jgi:hypothetical protein
MTKKKKGNPDNKLTEEKKQAHVAEALDKILEKHSGEGFLVRTRKVFFGTVYCLSVAFFSCLFGILAAILLPILLPLAFLVGKIRGRNHFKEAIS